MDKNISARDGRRQEAMQGEDIHRGTALVNPNRLREGMRHFASGVWVLTTLHHGNPFGLVATSVASVSLDPPSVLCSVNRAAMSHPAIVASGRFCLNLLGRQHQPLAEQFADPLRKAERFGHGEWGSLTTGAPALADALTSLDCLVSESHDFGTHTIFVGTVVDVRTASGHADPLVHFEGGFGGFSR